VAEAALVPKAEFVTEEEFAGEEGLVMDTGFLEAAEFETASIAAEIVIGQHPTASNGSGGEKEASIPPQGV
jgi:hypothetical protein